MTIKDGDCKSCEHFVKDAYGQFVCEFDGECENMVREMNNEEWLRQANKEEMEHTLTMLIMKDRFFADKEFAYVNIRFGVHCWLKEIHHE